MMQAFNWIQMKIHRMAFMAALAIVAACTDYQEPEAPDKLGVSVTELSFNSVAGSKSVTVSSGSQWTVASKPDWVTVQSIVSGTGIFQWTVAFAVGENSEYDREGEISIRSGSGTKNITVTQQGQKGKYVAVQSVSLQGSLTLTEGDTQKLTPTVSPSNASVKTVTWTSYDSTVATVDQNGFVTAVAEGSTTIRVTTDDGGKTATCDVTVKARVIHVTGVSLNKTSLTLTEGETATLSATVTPADATDKSVTWTSGDTSIATVSSDGVVTAVKAGTATITVTTTDGSKKANCSVTVKAKVIAVTGVALDQTSLYMVEGETRTLVATVAPTNATNQAVTWSSNNLSVATVSSEGVVSALKAGTATITVRTADGNKTATCTVTVSAATVAVTGVSLNQTTLTMTVGETETLTAVVAPTNATNKSVTWSSNNTAVATVSSSGVITAKTVGTATITVRTVDGGKTATCAVTVKPVAVSGVSLDKTSMSMKVGETQVLTATVSPFDAADQSVTWSSSNTKVATVTSAGVVSALDVGTSTITVTTNDGGKKATCVVTVSPVSVTGISLNQTSLFMVEGETQTLMATITPSNATDKTVTWSSNNSSVATVSSSGVVTAKAVGNATITVRTNDGGRTATCEVTVSSNVIEVTGVTLNRSTLTLDIGGTFTLTATVSPSNATDKSVTWSTEDASIAEVSSTGVVTAKKAGSTTITVTTSSGSKKATCAVTVNPIHVTGVSLSHTSLSLVEGDSRTLTATVTPDTASDKSVTWSSSNTSVATVSASGVVSAKKAGTATITVTTVDGGKTATCAVTVTPATVAVTGVSLDKTTLTLTEGDTYAFTATVTPSNATDKSVTWSSSNNSVATVSSSGVVTAVKAGSATITVTTTDGGKTATCSVTVNAATVPVTGVSLNNTSLSMKVGDTQTLTATITPSNATDKTVTWSSSNTSVATVSSAGVVTAKAAGSATITVTTNDGAKTATCAVTVVVPVNGVSLNNTSLTMNVGATQTLTATVTPSNATDKTVTWSSSNTSVATVSSSGLVTAKAAGSATITVTTNDGAKTATCAVTVVVPVTGVSLNNTTLTLTEGQTQTLTATVNPSNATNKNVTWSSNNTSVATVSSSGVVTAVKAGSATITVKTVDGNKTATCAVTVKSKDVNGSGNEGTGEEILF